MGIIHETRDRYAGTNSELYLFDNGFGALLIRNEFKSWINWFQVCSHTGETYCLFGEIYENLTDPQITEKLREIEKDYPQA